MEKLDFLKPINIAGKIRVGRNYDGGYVVYGKLLTKAEVLLSYGVGWDTSFEQHFNEITGKGALMFDPTLFGTYLLSKKILRTYIFNLRLGALFNYLIFILRCWFEIKRLARKNLTFVNEGIAEDIKPKYNTFNNHLIKYNLTNKQILLKIDIEEDEYKVFSDESIYLSMKNVNQIIIEFHNLKNRLLDAKNIILKLLNFYSIIHVHCNNAGNAFTIFSFLNGIEEDIVMPDILELTFVKSEMISPSDLLLNNEKYPIEGLDFPNIPHKPDLEVKFI